jgi:ABC-2 type transport system ATP-binding protein
MVIQTEQLRKQYADTTALKSIDLEIKDGGVVGLLGPNGAGKTTLVEIFEGLRTPTAGRVSVLGLDPSKAPQALKERLGVQLQSTSIAQDLTPVETLSLYSSFYKKSQPVSEVLERVGLAEKAKSRTSALSGGQKQRLALGMALINDPELIILDEPTTGLDPVARRGVHDIVREIKNRGRTVILTTHYIEEAELLCDRVIMIRAGEIVADGTPFELIGRAAGASTIWIAVDGALDPAPLLNTGAKAQGREGAHHRFTTTNPTAAILALGEMLKAQNLTLTDLRMKRPTLEDVYLELVGEVTKDEEKAAA